MRTIDGVPFNWLGKELKCPNKKLSGKSYKFYASCAFGKVEFKIGTGALVLYNNKIHVACIHYFYEDPNAGSKLHRCVVAVELFHNPKDIIEKFKQPITFSCNREIIKQDKFTFQHIPVHNITLRCSIVYCLESEDPEDIIRESATRSELIYVCRFIAVKKNDKFVLKGAVWNEIEILDNEENIENVELNNVENNKLLITENKKKNPKETCVKDLVLNKNEQPNDHASPDSTYTDINPSCSSSTELLSNLNMYRKYYNELSPRRRIKSISLNDIEYDDNTHSRSLPNVKKITKNKLVSSESDDDTSSENAGSWNLKVKTPNSQNSSSQVPVIILKRIPSNSSDTSSPQEKLTRDEKDLDFVSEIYPTSRLRTRASSTTPRRQSKRTTPRPSYVMSPDSPVRQSTSRRIAKNFDGCVVDNEAFSILESPKSMQQTKDTTKDKNIRLKRPLIDDTDSDSTPKESTGVHSPRKSLRMVMGAFESQAKDATENKNVKLKRLITDDDDVNVSDWTPTKSKVSHTPKKSVRISKEVVEYYKDTDTPTKVNGIRMRRNLTDINELQKEADTNCTETNLKSERIVKQHGPVRTVTDVIRRQNEVEIDPSHIKTKSIIISEQYKPVDVTPVKSKALHTRSNSKSSKNITDTSEQYENAHFTPVKSTRVGTRASSTSSTKKSIKILKEATEQNDEYDSDAKSTHSKFMRTQGYNTPTRKSIKKSISFTEQVDEADPDFRPMKSKVLPTRSTRKSISCLIADQYDESDPDFTPRKSKIVRTPTSKRKSGKYSMILDDSDEGDYDLTPVKSKALRSPNSNKKLIKNLARVIEELDQIEVGSTPKKSKVARTPRRSIKNLSAVIEERDEVVQSCGTPMQKARVGLSAGKLPSRVPCRDNEYSTIYNFVVGRIKDQNGGCMYISGVPGTGKTMTVCRVMEDLESNNDPDTPNFIFIQLNALALTEPRQIYVKIIKQLLGKTMHWEEALNRLIKFFTEKKKKRSHVILIDELDKLCNKKQDVIYMLLDLPFQSVTPLTIITIANTMDLPERILTNKVNSRLGLVRLTFKPYSYKDLVQIVTERLSSEKIFKSEALELIARKVAAVSGDARRALAMCSRATEIAEEESKELVTVDIIDRVVNEMITSAKVRAIKGCSKLEQLILSSISNEVTRTGNEEVSFINMMHKLKNLCLLENVNLPSIGICQKLCHHLGSYRLLITQHGRSDINMPLLLNISIDDIHFALR